MLWLPSILLIFLIFFFSDTQLQTSSESVKQSQQMKEMREHVNKLEEQMSVLRAAKIDAEEQRDGYRDAYNELAEQVLYKKKTKFV